MTDRRARVDNVVRVIQKKYGLPEDTLVITRGSMILPPVRIPTGILSLDTLMNGGFPMGMFSTIYGDVSTCKTTLAYMTIAEAQRMGLVAVYINAEARYNEEWAAAQGVDTEELYIINPEGASAEQILDAYIAMVKERAVDLVVIDSLNMLAPSSEQKRTMSEDTMALTARILSKFFRKSTGLTSKGGTCCLFIGQIRDTMSEYARKISSLSGGHALKHISQYILCTGRKLPKEGGYLSRKDGFVWTEDAVKTTGPGEGTRLEYDFRYTPGVDKDADVLTTALAMEVIHKGGGGYYIIPTTVTGTEEVRIRGYSNLVEEAIKYMSTIRTMITSA